MIKYVTSFLNKEEIDYFIEIFHNENTKYHNDKMIIRNLNWSNISVSDYKNNTYDKNNNYISVCEWR